ncbi:uncharacterized protein LOC111797464 [Cucurbita pepo subsp. pepo]|uniref:uncharacterized protein LOC111797464 n=1 Tax=Cucurbita pepo subsp. pepo TaxID=3664 RepID=UPI000C9D6EEE|nr:uncharacterized protein LOC111797464 [Cucurbita pepo subsp. pepo]
MAVEDDFSFPTALEPFNRCGIDSPPLWRLSPTASPISYRQKTASNRSFRDDQKSDRFASVRFSASLQRRRRFSSDAAMDGEEEEEEVAAEKMDVLWENFNEELSRSGRSRLMKTAEMEEIEIVKARRRMAELNLSETSGAVVTRRKATGKTAFVKALKKLFLLHNNSRRNLQTRSL